MDGEEGPLLIAVCFGMVSAFCYIEPFRTATSFWGTNYLEIE